MNMSSLPVLQRSNKQQDQNKSIEDNAIHKSSKEYLESVCDPCSSVGEKAEAFGFCLQCDDRLCDMCYRSHARTKASKHHTLRYNDAMTEKSDNRYHAFEELLIEKDAVGGSQDSEISENGILVRTQTRRLENEYVANMPDNTDLVREISSKNTGIEKENINGQKDLEKYTHVKQIDVETEADEGWRCDIREMALLSNTEMVLCDYENRSLKLIDINKSTVREVFQFNFEFDFILPFGLAVISADLVAVVLEYSYQIKIISTRRGLHEVKTIKTNGNCLNVDCVNEKLYVSFRKPVKFQKLNQSGTVLQTIKPDSEVLKHCIFPNHFTVTLDENIIYISDQETNKVLSMDMKGNLINLCKYELECPTKIIISPRGSIYLCDPDLNIVLKMQADLSEAKVVLGQEIYSDLSDIVQDLDSDAASDRDSNGGELNSVVRHDGNLGEIRDIYSKVEQIINSDVDGGLDVGHDSDRGPDRKFVSQVAHDGNSDVHLRGDSDAGRLGHSDEKHDGISEVRGNRDVRQEQDLNVRRDGHTDGGRDLEVRSNRNFDKIHERGLDSGGHGNVGLILNLDVKHEQDSNVRRGNLDEKSDKDLTVERDGDSDLVREEYLNVKRDENLDVGRNRDGGVGDMDVGRDQNFEELYLAKQSDGVSNIGRDGNSNGRRGGNSDGARENESYGGQNGKSDKGRNENSDYACYIEQVEGRDNESVVGQDGNSDGGCNGNLDGACNIEPDEGRDNESVVGQDGNSDVGCNGNSDGALDIEPDGGRNFHSAEARDGISDVGHDEASEVEYDGESDSEKSDDDYLDEPQSMCFDTKMLHLYIGCRDSGSIEVYKLK